MPSSCLICVLGRKAWKGGRRPCLLEPCPNYRTGSRHKLETHRTRKRAGQWWSMPSYALAAILRHYGGRDLSAGPTRLRLQAPQLFLQPDSHSLECASRDSHPSLGGPRLPISSPELFLRASRDGDISGTHPEVGAPITTANLWLQEHAWVGRWGGTTRLEHVSIGRGSVCTCWRRTHIYLLQSWYPPLLTEQSKPQVVGTPTVGFQLVACLVCG